MDEGQNEFLPSSIVKSFHCHWRACESLMKEGASVRKSPSPAPCYAFNISPSCCRSIDKSKSVKIALASNESASGELQRWLNKVAVVLLSFIFVNTHTHSSYWTLLFQGKRERERESEPLYGKCLWPGWQLGLMDGLPPSGCSACNKFPCSCLTSLTYQTHLSLLGRPRGTHNYEARCRQGAGIVLFMGPGPRAKSPKNR